jgi:manganese/zinc/iron transport system ATP- binding protein
VFVVHHDLQTVKEYFDWCLLLNRHLIAAGSLEQVLTLQNLERAYGKNAQIFTEVIGRML